MSQEAPKHLLGTQSPIGLAGMKFVEEQTTPLSILDQNALTSPAYSTPRSAGDFLFQPAQPIRTTPREAQSPVNVGHTGFKGFGGAAQEGDGPETPKFSESPVLPSTSRKTAARMTTSRLGSSSSSMDSSDQERQSPIGVASPVLPSKVKSPAFSKVRRNGCQELTRLVSGISIDGASSPRTKAPPMDDDMSEEEEEQPVESPPAEQCSIVRLHSSSSPSFISAFAKPEAQNGSWLSPLHKEALAMASGDSSPDEKVKQPVRSPPESRQLSFDDVPNLPRGGLFEMRRTTGKMNSSPPTLIASLEMPEETDSPTVAGMPANSKLPSRLTRPVRSRSISPFAGGINRSSDLPPAGPSKHKHRISGGVDNSDGPPGMKTLNYRMFNRAPSATWTEGEHDIIRQGSVDGVSDSNTPPSTPHSPDPLLIAQGGEWSTECPPTPCHNQKIQSNRSRETFDSMRGSDDGNEPIWSRNMARRNSLVDNKVLVTTETLSELSRKNSAIVQQFFKFSDHFVTVKHLGTSKFSDVKAVKHLRSGEMYAVKKTKREFKNKKDRETCLQEIMAVAEMPNHPNIVGHYMAWQEDMHFYIQMDFCGGGSLHEQIERHSEDGTPMKEGYVWRILQDVSRGLAFIHHRMVTHLDIKPENIYKDGKGNFRVGDFGMAVLRNEWAAEEGDGDYVAPEALKSECPGAPADVYSLGITIYECATLSKLPRSGEGRLAGNVQTPGRSFKLLETIRWMMATEPNDRPTAKQLSELCAGLAEPPAPSLPDMLDPSAPPSPDFVHNTLKRRSNVGEEEEEASKLPNMSPLRGSGNFILSRRLSRCSENSEAEREIASRGPTREGSRRQLFSFPPLHPDAPLLGPAASDSPDIDPAIRRNVELERSNFGERLNERVADWLGGSHDDGGETSDDEHNASLELSFASP